MRTWNASWRGHVITVEEFMFSHVLCIDGVQVDRDGAGRRLCSTLKVQQGSSECKHEKRPGASFCPFCGGKLDGATSARVVATMDSQRIQIYAGGECILDKPRW